MDIMVVIRFVPVFVGIATIGKIIYDMMYATKAKLRDEYKFAKEFLDEENLKKVHPFARDKGYQAIAGCTDITSKEIAYLLSLSNPIQRLNDYKMSRRFFKNDQPSGDFALIYKNRYKSNVYRWLLKAFYMLLYIALALVATSPYLYPEYFGQHGIFTLMITLPLFGYLAIQSLYSGLRVICAERLMKKMDYHSSNIILR